MARSSTRLFFSGMRARTADGELSAAERAAVSQAAKNLDLATDHVVHILAQIKDFMLAHLSGLPDAGSVAVVAKELG